MPGLADGYWAQGPARGKRRPFTAIVWLAIIGGGVETSAARPAHRSVAKKGCIWTQIRNAWGKTRSFRAGGLMRSPLRPAPGPECAPGEGGALRCG
jgi:hypothetical protein